MTKFSVQSFALCLVLIAATVLASPDASQEKIVSDIRRLGGTVELDDSRPDKPIVAVRVDRFEDADAVIKCVKTLTALRELSVTYGGITDVSLRQLSGLTELRTLDLSATKITDDGLKTVASFAKLEVLGLTGCEKITDNGLKHLKGLKNLQRLDLCSTHIGDAGLKHLQGLTKLRMLHFVNTNVTDAGLQTLEALPELHGLDLERSGITDAGLEHLKNLTKLQQVRVNCKNTNKAVKALRKALPKTFVIYDPDTSVPDAWKPECAGAMLDEINAAKGLAAEVVKREAVGEQAGDQKEKALAIIDKIVVSHVDIGEDDSFAVAGIAFMFGANDKAIAVMEKLVQLRPKEQSPGGLVAPVDLTGTLRIGTYARYGNNPKRAAAAYISLLNMAKESPELYGGNEVFCWLYLAEIEAHFNHDSAKAIAWLDHIVQLLPPRVIFGEPGNCDNGSDNGRMLCRNLARHEIALLQHKQPDWRGALDDGESVYMLSYFILFDTGLAGDHLMRQAVRSNVSRLDRAMAQHLLGGGTMEQAFVKGEPSYLKDLMASDSFFAPAGGVGLARLQMKAGKPDEARETLRKLTARFPSLKGYFEEKKLW